MPRKLPPIKTRFPVNRKDHTKKGPYLLPMLNKFLNKKITHEDPETQKIIQGRVKDAIVWRLILNATQGDNIAIKEIIDRIDGKAKQAIEHSGEVSHKHFLQDIINKANSIRPKVHSRLN